MARATVKRKRKSGGGRRANYAKARREDGYRKYLPISWANWLGFALFGLLTIALIVQVFWTLADLDRYGNDWIAALGMTVLFAVMTYLFATTRTKDF